MSQWTQLLVATAAAVTLGLSSAGAPHLKSREGIAATATTKESTDAMAPDTRESVEYHSAVGTLRATLEPKASTGPCTVLEIDRDSVPTATTWFRLRSATPRKSMPAPIGGALAADGALWFPLTPPKPPGQYPQGEQHYPFLGTGVFNAGNVKEIVPANLSAPRTVEAFVAEAWSDRGDLGAGENATLLAASPPLTFTFDDQGFSQGLKFDNFAVTTSHRVPGLLTVTAQPTNATAYAQARLISWFAFNPIASAPRDDGAPIATSNDAVNSDVRANGGNEKGLTDVSAAVTEGKGEEATTGGEYPGFTLDTVALGDAYSTRLYSTPSANLSFSNPGIYYVGIYGAWNGGYGFSDPKPENGVRTYYSFPLDSKTGRTFQPLAVVIPWENGTAASPPPNFGGPVHTAAAIPGDWRLALRVSSITVFNGGSIHLPLIHGPRDPNGYRAAPDAIEIELPPGLTILPPTGGSSLSVGYTNVSDVTSAPGGGPVPAGYRRLRLVKPPRNEWAYENGAVTLKVAVDDASLEGKTFSSARVRAYVGVGGQTRADNWQPLSVTVEALTPVSPLPKRLHTAYCWSGWSELADDPSRRLNPVTTWKALGFNTVPTDGASYAMPPLNPGPVLSPANRTGPEWVGMKYGIATSPYGTAGLTAKPHGIGSCTALKIGNISSAMSDRADGFNFSAAGISPAQEVVERRKWKAALTFFNQTGVMDLSYDGFFFSNDVHAITNITEYAQPDFLTMDTECMPELETYVAVADKSANFAPSRVPGETVSATALRLAQRWIVDVTTVAVAARKGHLTPALYSLSARYDRGFQSTGWPAAAAAGLQASPSYYSLMGSLDVLAATVRAERLAVGTSVSLVPWLTPGQSGGTGGPQTADPRSAMFNALIQVFASGATGFNMFTTEGMYDMGLWLAMRDAIAIVTPYEDLLFDGVPAPQDTFGNVAATAVVSGMVGPTATSGLLIASSTIPSGLPTHFTVTASGADATWRLCNVATGMSVGAVGKVASWTSESEPGSVFLFGAATPCH